MAVPDVLNHQQEKLVASSVSAETQLPTPLAQTDSLTASIQGVYRARVTS